MAESSLVLPTKHTTPLRYPGGKGKLADYVKDILAANELLDGHYVEPFAGGAGIALELLLHEYVRRIHINDICQPIYAFWKSVLDHTDELCRMISDAKLSVENWDLQKAVLSHPNNHSELELGFATFFLNRTNRSGILNAGIIGGRNQTGPWKIDARYNSAELSGRIQAIARLRSRIELTCEDACVLIKRIRATLPTKTLFYLDPPYYDKGKALYLDFYQHKDHEKISALIRGIKRQKWIVSYDNVPNIRALYKGNSCITYGLRYSAREACEGTEIMFFHNEMIMPTATDAMKRARRFYWKTE